MSGSDWDVLGLAPGASREEIKRAFRRRVKLYHPDLHPGDLIADARMKELTRAYARLMSRHPDSARSDLLFARSAACPAAGGRDEDERYRRLVRSYVLQESMDRARNALRLAAALAVVLVPLAGLALGGAAALPHLVRSAGEAACPPSQDAQTILVVGTGPGQIMLVPLDSPAAR